MSLGHPYYTAVPYAGDQFKDLIRSWVPLLAHLRIELIKIVLNFSFSDIAVVCVYDVVLHCSLLYWGSFSGFSSGWTHPCYPPWPGSAFQSSSRTRFAQWSRRLEPLRTSRSSRWYSYLIVLKFLTQQILLWTWRCYLHHYRCRSDRYCADHLALLR